MNEAYRGQVPRCPACGASLETQVAGVAEIDVCSGCGGMWFDWTDGELTSLARSVPPGTAATPATRGDNTCPRCHDPLGDDEAAGVAIGRCGSCGGAFVSRAGTLSLAKRLPRVPANSTKTLGERLGRWLKLVFYGHPIPDDDDTEPAPSLKKPPTEPKAPE